MKVGDRQFADWPQVRLGRLHNIDRDRNGIHSAVGNEDDEGEEGARSLSDSPASDPLASDRLDPEAYEEGGSHTGRGSPKTQIRLLWPELRRKKRVQLDP